MKTWLLRLTLVLSSLALFSYTKHPSRAKSKSSSASVSRSLAFPVKGSKSRIKDVWGASRGGGIRRHKGIDIHAKKGTPVVAISDGVIVEKARMPIGGKTLWLKSDRYGWKAYYAHLDKQLVKEGQHVKKGQVIGTIGNTGNARTTPSHLHFGIAGSKGWINPMPYVKNAPKVAAAKTNKKKSATSRSKSRKRR
ncbi:MAG: family metallopeptidase [Flaviaesturariibacter sp.]|nr:family metallopeptidase [Flaviaesturariibacter sp.]